MTLSLLSVGVSPLFSCMAPRTENRETVAGIAGQVAGIAERVAASEGIEVVDVEWKGGGGNRMLRIVIDRPDGITHGDCEFVSKQVGTILDMEDVIPGARYTLEVSSPGLERKLRGPQDFERFAGRKAKVWLREPFAGRRYWQGTLRGFRDGVVTLEPSSGEPVCFELEAVERANLTFEW